jgi:hypothetical protein
MSRLIDPREQIERIGDESLGYVPASQLIQGQERLKRFSADPDRNQRYIYQESIPFYRENIPGTAATAYLMRVGVPSSTSAWASITLPLIMPANGRILCARLYLSEVWVGGDITLRVRVIEGSDTTDYDLAEVVIDGTTESSRTTQQAAAFYPWANAIQVSRDATIECRLIVGATFTPTTADATAVITMGYEES